MIGEYTPNNFAEGLELEEWLIHRVTMLPFRVSLASERNDLKEILQSSL